MGLRVLEECRVSAQASPVLISGEDATADDEQQQKQQHGASFLPFTFFDVTWLYLGSVEFVFFYRWAHPTTDFLLDVLPSLKTSLTVALRLFYPLAGRIATVSMSSPSADVDNDDDDARHRRRYGISSTAGDSIPLTVAESDADLEALASDRPRDCAMLRALLPTLLPSSDDVDDADPAAAPLLAIQITAFPNQGFSIAVAVRHAACDGSTSMHFLKSWAAACRRRLQCGAGATTIVENDDHLTVPVYYRTLFVPDPADLYSIYLDDLESFGALELEKMAKGDDNDHNEEARDDMVIATFRIGRERIEKLKKHVMTTKTTTTFRCSTFVLALAYTWRCVTKTIDHSAAATAHAIFVVNCRSRLHPPVPDAYFGNCLIGCIAEAEAGDLAGDDGVYAAAEAIGTATDKFLGDGVLNGAETAMKRFLSAISVGRPLTVAGSPKLRVYDLDFGWGRPAKVEFMSIEKTGAISMSEMIGAVDGEKAGVEIGIALPSSAMDAFASLFDHGFDLL